MDGNNTTTTTTKGLGLKKWRRIPRDSAKDAPSSSSADSAKAVVLKRLLSSAAAAADSDTSSKSSTAATAPPKPKPKPNPKPKPKPNPNPNPDSAASRNPAKGKKHRSHHNADANGHDHRDPLLHSVFTLQSLHDALAKEVELFGEMATEPVLSLDELAVEDRVQDSCLQAKVLSLQHNVEALETKLDEARSLLADNETDLEALFKQRIAAEIEYLAITSATESVTGKQATLFKELESAAEGQAEVLARVAEIENKATKLKKEAHDHHDILEETKDVLVTTRRRAYKVTLYFLTQLIFFMLALWSLVSKLSPDLGAVVPT